jgi:hypothetical protein
MSTKRKHPDTDAKLGTSSPMPRAAGRRGGNVHRSTGAMKKGRRGTFP